MKLFSATYHLKGNVKDLAFFMSGSVRPEKIVDPEADCGAEW